MKALSTLPAGYREIFRVNLQQDKKLAIGLNLAACLLFLLLAIPLHFIVSITTLFSFADGATLYVLRWVLLLVGLVVYTVFHELVHGITMKAFGCHHVKYGFSGLYAYAGCNDFFDKKSYLIIALAPVVIWGIVLTILLAIVPDSWFWVVAFIQLNNLAGAIGDLYVTVRFSRMPKDVLIHDTGYGMIVYSQSAE